MGNGKKSCPAPYFDAGGITIYNADYRDLWPIEADVIVTDPPYGMRYVSHSGRELTAPVAGDEDTAVRDELLERWGDRPALVFGTWKAARPQCRALIVWDKGGSPGMGDLSLPWGHSHEEIYVRGSGWVKRDKRLGSVIRVPVQAAGDPDRPGHPTPKPVALMRHFLERCPPGVVLDPCMGSGSTLVAGKQLGRQVIGVDIVEQYCAEAVERLGQESLDLGI